MSDAVRYVSSFAPAPRNWSSSAANSILKIRERADAVGGRDGVGVGGIGQLLGSERTPVDHLSRVQGQHPLRAQREAAEHTRAEENRSPDAMAHLDAGHRQS